MSRIGRLPIPRPAGVEVSLGASRISVKGPKGELELTLHPDMTVAEDEGNIVVSRPTDERQHRALHGMTRALIANMVTGVTVGYRRDLEIQGVGFVAEMRGRVLNLKLGFTHLVVFNCPPGINITCPKNTQIVIEGIDRQLVGEVAATIRKLRPPEPYKGKGIRYKGEYVEKKAGKSGKK
ncbi:MAG: 50S ribosomal protein L6 [Calditrichaeota bacterium]|nr:50S ribosomal protein L6 [Candidatus Cloacimonadota bacterium]MCB1045728.1 50S ribosomal protein L6 [Calditrichota bacterium]MCB9472276.1 50S ribosomal protein L6 [Candidatus Delongbacteria bacterium]